MLPCNALSIEEKTARFWSRVIRKENEECWGWTGKTDKDGYGIFAAISQFNEIRAHRVSYVIHVGAIPKGIFVLHTCDNRPCTNPRHLFLGTALDNSQDMIRKGRQVIAVGSGQGSAKLHESVINEIRQRYQSYYFSESVRTLRHPDNQSSLAREFGVDQAQISRIVNGSAWIHV